ncbi:MAG: hypothetical protein D6805_03085 [Planctomycetota bacterium]|nr:MAG: hypothetical protein D6805_03085 [Planctomycetota bacterium]
MNKNQEKNFAIFAIKLGLATKQQILEAIQLQRHYLERGNQLSLDQILLQRGVLTQEQIHYILQYQQQNILTCSGCSSQYFIGNYKPGKRVKCHKCGSIFVVPHPQGLASPLEEEGEYQNSVAEPVPFVPSSEFPPLSSSPPLMSAEENLTQPQAPHFPPPPSPAQPPSPFALTEKAPSPTFDPPPTPLPPSTPVFEQMDAPLPSETFAKEPIVSAEEPKPSTTSLSPPAEAPTSFAERRSGKDRRKRPDIRIPGDRRKGGDRRRVPPTRENASPTSISPLAKWTIVAGFSLGGIAILILSFLLLLRPSKRTKIKVAKKNFYFQWNKAKEDLKIAELKELEKAYEKYKTAMEEAKPLLDNVSQLEEKLQKDLKTFQKEYNSLEKFFTALKSKPSLFLEILDEVPPSSPLAILSLQEIAKRKHPKGLFFLQRRLRKLIQYKDAFSFQKAEYSKLLNLLLFYRNTAQEIKAVRILSSLLSECVRRAERLNRREKFLSKAVEEALKTIQKFPTKESAKSLRKLIENSEGKFYLSILHALHNMGGAIEIRKEAIPAFVYALGFGNNTVKKTATRYILEAGMFAIPFLEEVINNSDPEIPPVDAIYLVVQVCQKLQENEEDISQIIRSFRNILQEALEKERYDLCYYCMKEMVKLNPLPASLLNIMQETIRKITQLNPEERSTTLQPIYFSGFFSIAKHLNLSQEQLKIASWMTKLYREKKVEYQPIAIRKLRNNGGSQVLLNIRNNTDHSILFYVKTETSGENLTIPPLEEKNLTLSEGSIYDILAISTDNQQLPYYAYELLDAGGVYSLVFNPSKGR